MTGRPIAERFAEVRTQTTKALRESKLTKVCRRCGQVRSLADYMLPRHKVCAPCRERIRQAAHVWHREDTIRPPRELIGLTATREGYNKYQRERGRRERGDVKPPLNPPKIKLCVRCKREKPAREFENYRVRICIACDGSFVPFMP